MRITQACLISVAIIVVLRAGFEGKAMADVQADVGRPEPVLFLLKASEEMERYHGEHGKYADRWHRLNFHFARGGYRVTDPGIDPTEEDGARWRPKKCKYTYVIESADKNSYLIRAINEEGSAEYEIEQGMDKPKKLPDKEPCTAEARAGEGVPEPVHFLEAAAPPWTPDADRPQWHNRGRPGRERNPVVLLGSVATP